MELPSRCLDSTGAAYGPMWSLLTQVTELVTSQGVPHRTMWSHTREREFARDGASVLLRTP